MRIVIHRAFLAVAALAFLSLAALGKEPNNYGREQSSYNQ